MPYVGNNKNCTFANYFAGIVVIIKIYNISCQNYCMSGI